MRNNLVPDIGWPKLKPVQSLIDAPEFKAMVAEMNNGINGFPPSQIQAFKDIITSTTVITGLKAVDEKGGDVIVAASDGQSTSMRALEKHDKEAEKLHKVGPRAVIGLTGSSAFCDKLAKIVEEILAFDNLIARRNRTRLDIDSQVGRLASAVGGNLMYAVYLGIVAIPLLSITDDKTGEGRIYHFDVLGGFTKAAEGYWADGCGRVVASGFLAAHEPEIKAGLPEEEAVKLAVKVIAVTIKKNAGCGGKISVSVIDKRGIRKVSQQKIREICNGPEIRDAYDFHYETYSEEV